MWTTVPPAKSSIGRVEIAAIAPHHVRHGEVHEERPQRGEKRHGAKGDALGKRAGNQRGCDDGEHELIDHERLVGNGGRVKRIRFGSHAAQEQVAQVADERVARGEHQAIAADRPQEGDPGHHGKALHHGAEHVLLAYQTAIEQGQTGTRHHEHERGTDQHPGVVAGRLGGGYGDPQGSQFGGIPLGPLR
jgi:hypothetical protein